MYLADRCGRVKIDYSRTTFGGTLTWWDPPDSGTLSAADTTFGGNRTNPKGNPKRHHTPQTTMPEYGFLNEFDEALLEMTNAVKEADPQNRVEMQKMVEGWVSIEDSEFCRDVMTAEVEELMDLDVLCNLKDDPQEDAEDDKSDDEEVVEAGSKEPITAEYVNDLAAKLKSLSVQVGDMGEEFASVSFGISDLSIELSSRFRRLGPKGKGGKPKKEGRQSNMQAFLKKGGGTKE